MLNARVHGLRRVLMQQVGGHNGFALHDGRHLKGEIVVPRELDSGVFARQFVGRTAAVRVAAPSGRRRVRTLSGRRRRRRGHRGGHHLNVRLRGRQRRRVIVVRRHFLSHRLADCVHLVLTLQVLRQKYSTF